MRIWVEARRRSIHLQELIAQPDDYADGQPAPAASPAAGAKIAMMRKVGGHPKASNCWKAGWPAAEWTDLLADARLDGLLRPPVGETISCGSLLARLPPPRR